MKITFTNFVFGAVLLMAVPGIAVSQGYSGGSGTSASPYQIADTTDLKYLSEHSADWSKYFIQTADIKFSAANFEAGGGFYNSGAGFIPIGNFSTYFTGKYDGNGHTIDGLTMNRTSSSVTAMFGVIDGSNDPTITNLGLINVNITGYQYYVAALVGQIGNTLTSTCSVTNCYSTGTVTSGGGSYVGGLVGYIGEGSIRTSYSTCTVQGSGVSDAGGLVGYIYQYGTVSNCFARGNVGSPTSTNVGGFAGYTNGSSGINDCYSTGAVSGSSNANGFVGSVGASAIVSNCFWDTTTSGKSSDGGTAVGKSTSQMQTESTFSGAGWDFTNTWQIASSEYPTLQGLQAPGSFIVTTGTVSSFATTTATLNGSVNPGGGTAAVRFLYGTSSGTYTDSTAATPDTVSGSSATSVSASLTGLSSGTKYYYIVSAASSSQYARGSENSFVTSSAVWGNDLVFSQNNSTYAKANHVATTAIDSTTIEAWVKWDGTSGPSGQVIVSNGYKGTGGYGIYLYPGNKLGILICAKAWLLSDSILTPNVWTYLAMVVEDSVTWRLYENGKSIDISKMDAPTYAIAPSTNLFVGGDSVSYYFNGEIDEVRVSNTVRYTSNFTPPTAPFTTDANTVALYHFNEASGSVAGDSSGNGNDLTLVNSPTWIGSDNPAAPTDVSLAVQATGFEASSSVGSVTLTWQTQSEVDNAGFEIFRQQLQTPNSEPGTQNWQLVSSYTSNNSLRGMGTSTTGRSYRFTDYRVVAGASYAYRIRSVSTDGGTKELSTLTVTVGVPKTYALYQNYPDPFNPTTTIRFDLKEQSNVTLAVYNVLGQEVEHWNYRSMDAGRYNEDINMTRFASGVYFYRIVAEGKTGQRFVAIRKLMLMK